MPKPLELPPTGFCRTKTLLALIPISRHTLYRNIKDGTFPKPVRISKGIVAWPVEVVRKLIADMKRGV